MLVGFNTNISYKDKTYHVQTEDSGKNNPVVVTLLYYQGAILASRKTDYSQLLDDPDFKAKVTKLMKVQHKGMIRDLLTGKHTGELKEKNRKKKPKKTRTSPGQKKSGNRSKLQSRLNLSRFGKNNRAKETTVWKPSLKNNGNSCPTVLMIFF